MVDGKYVKLEGLDFQTSCNLIKLNLIKLDNIFNQNFDDIFEKPFNSF